MPLKGIYIEDDSKNIVVTRQLFRQEGLDVCSLPFLPSEIEELYPMVLDQRADFLLIDHELNKAVPYTGFEALSEIRKHDRTIYAILLTNFTVDDFKDEFGSYDLEVHKSELNKDDKMKEIATKIRRACERIDDMKVLAQADAARKQEEEKLEILRQIQKSLSDNNEG